MAHTLPFLTQVCPFCNGTGMIAGVTCTFCKGTGRHKELGLTVPECFAFSTEVFNLIEGSEYVALTVDQKDYLRILLSCVMVDLRTGSQMRAVLFALFGAGSLTRTRLEALLAEFTNAC